MDAGRSQPFRADRPAGEGPRCCRRRARKPQGQFVQCRCHGGGIAMTEPLRVLVACEFSGTVRRAFATLGHDAWSCDLLPAEDRSNKHIVGDVRDILGNGWDLMVSHPPCTRLCNSGVRWLTKPPAGKTLDQMWRELDEGAELFSELWNAPIERIAVETR